MINKKIISSKGRIITISVRKKHREILNTKLIFIQFMNVTLAKSINSIKQKVQESDQKVYIVFS